ncbi:MAG TPA: hypothetical protein PKW90_20835, partial [Myxococcota bacterium]|nr:hypothetical protein [Myxococcota bacterium]
LRLFRPPRLRGGPPLLTSRTSPGAALSAVSLLVSTLRRLAVGQRAWFVYSPALPEAPLRLCAWSDDPSGSLLREQLVGLDPHAPRSQGLLSIGEDGRPRLTSSHLLPDQLASLAVWARDLLEEEPDLARLRGAVLQEISADGRLSRRDADDRLWEEFPERNAPGSLAASADLLEAATGPLYLCLRTGGPGPFLLLSADAAGFEVELQHLRARGRGEFVIGLYQPRGKLLNVEPASAWTAALSQLLERWGATFPALKVLKEARLLDEGPPLSAAAVTPAAPAGPDLSLQQSLLGSITPEGPIFYWFTPADPSGQPMLLLHPELEGVKALAAELDGAPPLARGQLFLSSQGWLDFRLRAEVPGFLAALVGWTHTHISSAPGLARLVGARLTVRDATGKIISGTRDDAAWARVSAALES